MGWLELAAFPFVMSAWVVATFTPVVNWSDLYFKGVVSIGSLMLGLILLIDAVLWLDPDGGRN